MKIEGLGITPLVLTMSGLPSVDTNALQLLVGNVEKEKYGHVYNHFK